MTFDVLIRLYKGLKQCVAGLIRIEPFNNGFRERDAKNVAGIINLLQ